MSVFDAQITTLFSWDIFRKILNNEQISLYKFNILTSMLIANGIPFDVSFASGTRKDAAALELTIYINPSATIVLVISLEPGSNIFSSE